MAIDSIHKTKEGVSARFSATLKDELGTVIEPADMSAITATLQSADDFDDNNAMRVINSRTNVNVYNQNGGTFAAGGQFAWLLTPADNAMYDESRSAERHLLTLKYTYSTAKTGVTKHLIIVENTEGL